MTDCASNLYTVKFTNKNKDHIYVAKGELVTDKADIAFVGKTRYDYGETLNENLLHLLEHFACPEDGTYTPPVGNSNYASPDLTTAFGLLLENPVEGQIWYNTTQDRPFSYDGTNWVGMETGCTVAGNYGVLAHGEQLPRPVCPSTGYTFDYSECTWIVAPFNYDSKIQYMACFTDENANVTMQYQPVGGSNTAGYVNYQIIGIRDNVNVGTQGPLPSLPALSPTPTPTETLPVGPSPTPTETVGASPTPTPTVTPTNTVTPTETPTNTPTVTPTKTVGASPTPTPTVTPTQTPTSTVTPTVTPTQEQTATPTQTVTPTQTMTSTPTVTPTQTPSSTYDPSGEINATSISCTRKNGEAQATLNIPTIGSSYCGGTFNFLEGGIIAPGYTSSDYTISNITTDNQLGDATTWSNYIAANITPFIGTNLSTSKFFSTPPVSVGDPEYSIRYNITIVGPKNTETITATVHSWVPV